MAGTGDRNNPRQAPSNPGSVGTDQDRDRDAQGGRGGQQGGRQGQQGAGQKDRQDRQPDADRSRIYDE